MTSKELSDSEKKSRSLLDFLFRTPDSEDMTNKASVATYLGSQIGAAASFGAVLLQRDVNFKNILFQRKVWAAGQVGKGFIVGGLSGFLYSLTVKQTSNLRGGKDDWINHFVGGFGGVLPYSALYKPTMRYFLIAGTLTGIFFGLTKIVTQTELVRRQYKYDERVVKLQTHYPEMYVCYEIRKDKLEAKRKLRELSEATH